MTSAGSILRWTALALAGLAIAAGVAFAASHLVSQRIGLASQPLNAGRELAPPSASPANSRQSPTRHNESGSRTGPTATTTTTTTAPTVPTVTAAPPAPPAPPVTSGGDGGQGGADD